METQVDAGAALGRAKEQDFDVVIPDLHMPAMDGVRFLCKVGDIRPHCVRMMLTDSPDFEAMQRAINDAGVFRHLCKPWQDEELAANIDAALAHSTVLPERLAHAHAWRDRLHTLSPQEFERQRCEENGPGITRVDWGSNGEVLMPPLNPSHTD